MRFLTLLLLCLTLTSAVLAQEATPEAVPDFTEVGALRVVLPEGWLAFEGRENTVLLSTYDLRQPPADGKFPQGTVVVQVSSGIFRQLASALAGIASPTALDVLKAIPFPQTLTKELVYEELERAGVALARVDISTEQGESIAYTRNIGQDRFFFVLTVAFTAGDLAPKEDELLGMIASLELNVSAPFDEDKLGRYDGLPQSLSPEGFYRLGNPDAPVRIVEISSFDCPHCRTFHAQALPMLLERVAAGEVLFTYLPIFGTGGIPNGETATRAALCAGEQGKFWEYHDGIFQWQDFGGFAFVYERLEEGALALGLDKVQWQDCLDAARTTQTIKNALDLVFSLDNFQGTPSVIMNDQFVTWLPVSFFAAQIDTLVAAAQK